MIHKLISGGQTGVDRAALDFVRDAGIPHGGWCPRGRWAEDGMIPAGYDLAETPSDDPAQRTEWNVRDSDATVIFSAGIVLTGGSKLAAEYATHYCRPLLHLSIEKDAAEATQKLVKFLQAHRVKILNVAGPRASEEPAAARFAREVLTQALGAGTKNAR